MKKVITYGTFDLFHEGHYNILKRAKEYGDYLIVGVTGENYDAQRGKLSVHDSLSKRIENVRKTGFADLIIVEEYIGQKIYDIIKYGIDVLVVGSDWRGKFDHQLLTDYIASGYWFHLLMNESNALWADFNDDTPCTLLIDCVYFYILLKEHI